jgi:PIN domain nuclease of toxin-antitoxin system
MNLLLDTHVLLWWLDDSSKLSQQAHRAISDGKRPAFVSVASIWEIRIKEALGKLKIPRNFQKVLEDQPFEILDITAQHAHAVSRLPKHHRDPFDRMLVAQAKTERLMLATRDAHLKQYNISILEA